MRRCVYHLSQVHPPAIGQLHHDSVVSHFHSHFHSHFRQKIGEGPKVYSFDSEAIKRFKCYLGIARSPKLVHIALNQVLQGIGDVLTPIRFPRFTRGPAYYVCLVPVAPAPFGAPHSLCFHYTDFDKKVNPQFQFFETFFKGQN